MPAYRVPIPRRSCAVCRKRATYEVFNRLNGSCGFFCVRHAKLRVKELDDRDRQMAEVPVPQKREA